MRNLIMGLVLGITLTYLFCDYKDKIKENKIRERIAFIVQMYEDRITNLNYQIVTEHERTKLFYKLWDKCRTESNLK